jgi:hypothetical protein
MSESNTSTSSIETQSLPNTILANKSRSDETTAKTNESNSLVLTELQSTHSFSFSLLEKTSFQFEKYLLILIAGLISMAIVLSKSSEFVPLAQIQEYVGKVLSSLNTNRSH